MGHFHMHHGHSKKIIGAGLLGFALGALAGIFLIPKSASENRKKFLGWAKRMTFEIRFRARKIQDLTQGKYNELVDQVAEKYRKMNFIKENELSDFVEELKSRWERIKDEWQSE